MNYKQELVNKTTNN